MNYNKIIGICIPTYKRPEQLMQCVRSIIAAAQSYNVPIFITDDSTDDTNNDTIFQLSKEYKHIIYIKNEQNLGIDRNILKCIDVCTCEYAWPIGEDDRMLPNAIKKALGILKNNDNNIPFVFANYVYVNNDVTYITSEKRINIDADMEIGATDFFEKYAWTIGFIGSCIINKKLWSASDSSKYIGTYFAHVGMILEYLYDKKAFLIADTLILNRAENVATFTWSEKAFEVNFGWDNMIKAIEPIYGKMSYKKALTASKAIFKHHSLLFLLSKKADKIYDIHKYNIFVRNANYPISYKIIAHLVAYFPGFPLSILKKCVVGAVSRLKQNKRTKISRSNSCATFICLML